MFKPGQKWKDVQQLQIIMAGANVGFKLMLYITICQLYYVEFSSYKFTIKINYQIKFYKWQINKNQAAESQASIDAVRIMVPSRFILQFFEKFSRKHKTEQAHEK